MSSGRSWPIAPQLLGAQQCKEETYCLSLVVEGMLDGAAASSDPSPSADNAGLAEQRRLDRQGVEPGQVEVRVTPFDVKPIMLRVHGGQNRAARIRRPMIGLNHWARFDSFL